MQITLSVSVKIKPRVPLLPLSSKLNHMNTEYLTSLLFKINIE